jgi:hypothetical protein
LIGDTELFAAQWTPLPPQQQRTRSRSNARYACVDLRRVKVSTYTGAKYANVLTQSWFSQPHRRHKAMRAIAATGTTANSAVFTVFSAATFSLLSRRRPNSARAVPTFAQTSLLLSWSPIEAQISFTVRSDALAAADGSSDAAAAPGAIDDMAREVRAVVLEKEQSRAKK